MQSNSCTGKIFVKDFVHTHTHIAGILRDIIMIIKRRFIRPTTYYLFPLQSSTGVDIISHLKKNDNKKEWKKGKLQFFIRINRKIQTTRNLELRGCNYNRIWWTKKDVSLKNIWYIIIIASDTNFHNLLMKYRY